MLLTHFLAEHNKILTESESFGYSTRNRFPTGILASNLTRCVINEAIH